MSEFKFECNIDNLDLKGTRGGFVGFLPDSVLSWLNIYDYGSEDVLIENLGVLDKKVVDFQNRVERNTGSYLTSQELEMMEEKADEIQELMRDLSSTKWDFQVDGELIKSFEEMKEEFRSSVNSLDSYNKDFVENEIERYGYLFQNGQHGLNSQQKRAVVRNDNFNQVVAGAGAGKTLVLIYRVAYLVEKGVDPKDIVVFSFTNKVADEVEKRLSENFDIEEVEVTTFHSWGFNELKGNPEVLNAQYKKDFVEEQLKSATPDSELGKHYRKFLSLKDAEFVSQDEFEEEKEYIKARRENDYRTIKGEKVKSRDEKAIADFLFTHNIDYRYEKKARWADTSKEKTGYEPDFYLPEYDLYIEHWGVDKRGEVADWFTKSSEEYLRQMDWKKEQFQKKGKELVETFHYEYRNNNLEQKLVERLGEYGVNFEPLTLSEIAEKTVDNERDKIVKYLVDFIELAGSMNKGYREVEKDLEGLNRKEYHYGSCGQILLKKYEKLKRERNEIDFSDMIHKAVEEMEERSIGYSDKYDHVLVDEFQDLSKGKIKMVKKLTGENGAKLFCVGDDWQSIYGFTGAKVEYFVDFEENFGKSTKTRLVKNYRSTKNIVETGNTLIENNSNQIEKQLESVKDEYLDPRLHSINGEGRRYQTNVAKHTVKMAEKYVREGSDPSDIMIISRLDEATHVTTKIRNKLKENGMEGTEILSAHKAKGREAKHVIVVNTSEEHAGFSPVNEGSSLNDIIREEKVRTEEEERRLFYVALTRSKETLDILTKSGKESSFLRDIKDEIVALNTVANPGEKGSRVTLKATVDKLRDGKHKEMKYWGVLKDSTGTKVFTVWGKAPDIEFKQEYIFRGIKVTEYQGEIQLKATEETVIEPVQ